MTSYPKTPKSHLSTTQPHWSSFISRDPCQSNCSAGLERQEAFVLDQWEHLVCQGIISPWETVPGGKLSLGKCLPCPLLAHVFRRLTGLDPVLAHFPSLAPCTLFQACVVRFGLLTQQTPTTLWKVEALCGLACWHFRCLIGSGEPLIHICLWSVGAGVALNENPSLIGQKKCSSLGFPGAQENSILEMQSERPPTAHGLCASSLGALPRAESDRLFLPGSTTSMVCSFPLSCGHKLFLVYFSKHLHTCINSCHKHRF